MLVFSSSVVRCTQHPHAGCVHSLWVGVVTYLSRVRPVRWRTFRTITPLLPHDRSNKDSPDITAKVRGREMAFGTLAKLVAVTGKLMLPNYARAVSGCLTLCYAILATYVAGVFNSLASFLSSAFVCAQLRLHDTPILQHENEPVSSWQFGFRLRNVRWKLRPVRFQWRAQPKRVHFALDNGSGGHYRHRCVSAPAAMAWNSLAVAVNAPSHAAGA